MSELTHSLKLVVQFCKSSLCACCFLHIGVLRPLTCSDTTGNDILSFSYTNSMGSHKKDVHILLCAHPGRTWDSFNQLAKRHITRLVALIARTSLPQECLPLNRLFSLN